MFSQISRDILTSDLTRAAPLACQRVPCGLQPFPLSHQRPVGRELAVQLGELLVDLSHDTPRSTAQYTTRTISHNTPPSSNNTTSPTAHYTIIT